MPPNDRLSSPPVAISVALDPLPVPAYLEETYWWAYVHPWAVRVFERGWLVNLILLGNYSRLRDAALAEIGCQPRSKTLQIACVYGDLTVRLSEQLADDATLDVVDVMPIQLHNLQRKLPAGTRACLLHRDSTALGVADATYDRVLLFFLLHEQPLAVRRRTVAAVRSPNRGKIVWSIITGRTAGTVASGDARRAEAAGVRARPVGDRARGISAGRRWRRQRR